MRILNQAVSRTAQINWRSRSNRLRVAAVLLILAFGTTGLLLSKLLTLSTLGYTGIALLALLASGGMVLPVPALAALCASSTALSPPLLGLIAGTAETVGELTGYLLGYSGRDIARRGRWYPRIEGWMRRRGWVLLLGLALIPNPLFDVAGVAAGALRYPLPAFLGTVWIGKVAKFTGIAYGCALGIEWVTRISE